MIVGDPVERQRQDEPTGPRGPAERPFSLRHRFARTHNAPQYIGKAWTGHGNSGVEPTAGIDLGVGGSSRIGRAACATIGRRRIPELGHARRQPGALIVAAQSLTGGALPIADPATRMQPRKGRFGDVDQDFPPPRPGPGSVGL